MDEVNTGPGVVATKEQAQGKDRDTAISEAKSPACGAIEQQMEVGLSPGQGDLVYCKGTLLILTSQRKRGFC